MKTRLTVRFVVFLALVSGVAVAYNNTPPASRTGAPAVGGAPAEGTCSCHGSNSTGGMIELINAPAYYQPGTVYTMIVRLTSGQTAGNSNRRWGFQLTAVRASDGAGTGTFGNVAGQGTTIISGSGSFATRQYIEQSTGSQQGATSPAQWQVNWTAPNPGVGPIRFFMSGVAGNGSGSSGDWVYTGSFSSDDVTPVLSSSWGDVKSRFRR